MIEFLPILLDGARVTVEVTVAAAVVAVLLAFASGLSRLSRSTAFRGVSAVYVELFRGSSLLVQLFWLFFVLPHFGITLTPFQTAALGLTSFQVMRHIVLPQALRHMLPLWGNLLIELLKGTSLVSLITVSDLAFRAYQLNQATFRTTEIFTMVLVIYGSLALLIVACTRGLERRLGRHMPAREGM